MSDDAPPYYWNVIDWKQLVNDYPPPPHFALSTGRLSEGELHNLQEQRFLERVSEAWEIPFYRERWSEAGLNIGDITSLEDLDAIPTFTSDDLKVAIENKPPFGNHYPQTVFDKSVPLKIQTSGGTTGMPRPTLFDPIAWEVQGIQMARALYAQGARPGDIGQITYTNALGNAAWTAYTAMHHWLGVTALTTGTGLVTPSNRQLEYAASLGTRFWFTRGEYLARLTQVAEEIGFDLRQLETKFLHSYLGPDTDGTLRHALEDAWGAPVYDNYGTHEIGLVAFECPAQNGRHVNEDTVYLQTKEVDSDAPVSVGFKGGLVATSLHRSVPPIIRYSLRDVMVIYGRRECECGLLTQMLSPLFGRSDEMVKLRGTNVYPVACQDAVNRDPRTSGDFLCVAYYEGEGLQRREEMVVEVERRSTDVDAEALRADLERAFHSDLGVHVQVRIVEPGSLAEFTRLGQDKVRRLRDLRDASSIK